MTGVWSAGHAHGCPKCGSDILRSVPLPIVGPLVKPFVEKRRYRCRACRKKTTALVLSRERVNEVRCQHCGSADLEKLWSRFASPKSEEARLEGLADDSALAGVDENNPAGMAKLMKKMSEATGENLGEDFEQAMQHEAGGGADDGEP